MKRITLSAWLLVALLTVGCEDDDGLLPPVVPIADPPHTGYIRATIDGRAFNADEYLTVYQNLGTDRQGSIKISSGTNDRHLALMLSFITGPGTYPLGVNPETTPGGIAVFNPSFLEWWETPLDGESGFVTVTVRTDKRIAGTFHFTAEEVISASGPPTISVTDGEFDITCVTDLPPLPTGVGSTFGGTIDGTSFNAATVDGIYPGGNTFLVTAHNTSFQFKVWSRVDVAEQNTYGIPSQIEMRLVEEDTPNSWSGGSGADIGTLSVLTQSSDRLVATFTATLQPVGASSPITVTGEIDSFLKTVATVSTK